MGLVGSCGASVATHRLKADPSQFPLPWPPAHSVIRELRDLLAYYKWLISPCASIHVPGNLPTIALEMGVKTAAGLLDDIAAADLSCVPAAPMHVLDALRVVITEALPATQKPAHAGRMFSAGAASRRKRAWRPASRDVFSHSPPTTSRPPRKRGMGHACGAGAIQTASSSTHAPSTGLAASTQGIDESSASPLGPSVGAVGTAGMLLSPLHSVNGTASCVDLGGLAHTPAPTAAESEQVRSSQSTCPLAYFMDPREPKLKAWPRALPLHPCFKPSWYPEDYYRSTQAISTLVATGTRPARACVGPQQVGEFVLQQLSYRCTPLRARSRPGVALEVPLATASLLVEALRASQYPVGKRRNARRASGLPPGRDFSVLRGLYFVLFEAVARRRECYSLFSTCLNSRKELSFADCSLTGE
jgi:hypothetical protein